ncbi:MAG: prepilin-type N-terminal cleavage/methylation domain-containing protein [Idiomarina sp.]|nr:prepilin-type N-terminal cleavage/methylation domain-containing protein [Idiomarina sp.]
MSLSLLELLVVLAIAASFAVWQLQALFLAQEPEVMHQCEHSIVSAQRYHAERYWFQQQGARDCG